MAVLFYHLAFGSFGAECLAKLRWYIGEGVERAEDHRFLWAGPDPRPVPARSWGAAKAPPWEFGSRLIPPPALGSAEPFQADRQAIADAVRVGFGENARGVQGPLAEAAKVLFRSHLTEVYGENGHPAVHVALCATLTDPRESALLLGWLAGFASMRSRGNHQNVTVHVVAAVGDLSADVSASADVLRAAAARGLYDLQAFARDDAAARGRWRAVPMYVVGDRAYDDGAVASSRPTQAALVALTLLGIAKDQARAAELRHGESGGDDGTPAPVGPAELPLRYSWTTEAASWGGQDTRTLGGPFAPVGAFAVTTAATSYARLLAARYATALFDAFEAQPLPPIPPPGERNPADAPTAPPPDELTPHQAKFQSELCRLALRTARERLVEWAHARPTDQPPTDWPAVEHIDELYGTLTDDPAWGRLQAAYGARRFLRIPVDDWESSFNEFQLVVERGFLSRRRRLLARHGTEFPRAIRAGLEAGIAEALRMGALDAGLAMEPHRLARRLLLECRAAIERHLDEHRIEATSARENPDADFAERSKVVDSYRASVLAAAREVPSPFAIASRAVLYLAAGLALGAAVAPEFGGPAPGFGAPLLLGLGLSLVPIALLVRFARGARRRLMAAFERWQSQYSGMLEEIDRRERRGAMVGALTSVLGTIEAMLTGDAWPGRLRAEDGPAPEGRPRLREIVGAGARDTLQATAKSHRDLLDRLTRAFQASQVEIYLPDVRPERSDALEADFREFVAGPARTKVEIEDLTLLLSEWAVPPADKTARVFPFGPLGHGLPPDPPPWTLDWTAARPEDGAPPAGTPESCSVRFIDALTEHFRRRLAPKSLMSRVDEEVRKRRQAVADCDILRRAHSRSEISLDVITGNLALFRRVVASAESDMLAAALETTGAARGNEGAGQFTSVVYGARGADARSLVSVPSEAAPRNGIGLAWRAHAGSSLPAFKAVVIPPEDSAPRPPEDAHGRA